MAVCDLVTEGIAILSNLLIGPALAVSLALPLAASVPPAPPPAAREVVADSEGVLRFSDDRSEVALFGVNFYAPFWNERPNLKKLYGLVSDDAQYTLRDRVVADPSLIGKRETLWLLASATSDLFMKGRIDRSLPAEARGMTDQEVAWLESLVKADQIELRLNRTFFTRGDSREPEQAGIWGAAVGSFITLLVTLLLSFPVGVAAAVYLEEFAPKNRLTDVIEVNINNLAAVPSIVFGLLGKPQG